MVQTSFVGLAGMQLRSELRGGFRCWGGAIVVLALTAGAALTAATAARRTDTAFARALSAGNAADAAVSVNALGTGPEATRLLDAVEHSAAVAAHGRFGGASLTVVRAGRVDPRFNTGTATGYLPYDGRAGVTVSRFRVLHGRAAAPDRADEVVVNEAFVRTTGDRVGDTIAGVRVFGLADVDENGNPDPHKGTPVTLRIVGVVKTPEEALAPTPMRIFATPALTHRFPDAPYYYQDLLQLKRGSADLPRLNNAIARLQEQFPGAQLFVSPRRDGLVKANRAADPLVNGLWILAALALAVGLLLAGQSFARVLTTRVGDNAQYRVIGASRAQRLRSELASVVLALAIAAALAVVLAWVFSPLTPVGTARGAEPNPGFTLHAGIALAAAMGVIVVGMLAVAPTAVRAAFSTTLPGQTLTPNRGRPSRTARAIANTGSGVPAVVGTQFAFEAGRGATATPVASVIASVALIVTTVTGTVAFGANLDRLVTTKRLYGWNWDAAVGTSFGAIPKAAESRVLHAPGVRAMAGLTLGQLTIGKRVVPAVGIDSLVGMVAPTLDSGRLPAQPEEIALGAKTMRTVHAHLGDEIVATIEGHRHRLHVVGTATFPAFGTASFTEAGLGTGAIGAAALFPQHDSQSDGTYNYFLLRYHAPGPTAKQIASLDSLLRTLGCTDSTCVLTDLRPNEIDGFRGARSLVLAVGVVLSLLLVATLTHALLSTMRRRQSDLAVLRALGCTRRQLESTMRWQTFMVTASALAVGIPLGLVANRFVWNAFTDHLGVAPGTVVPVGILVAGAAAVVTIGWLLATGAGRRAPSYARRQPIIA
jgi:hypothetical protein